MLYHDYISDLSGRCLGIFESFEQAAKEQKKEVTLLLMAATSAFVIPLERIRSKDLYSDSKEIAPSFDEELKKKWNDSPLFKGIEEWPLGYVKKSDWDEGPHSWSPPTTRVGDRDVEEVLSIIRNALAHGNLHTGGNLTAGDHIDLLRLHSEKRNHKKKVIGWRYLDICVSDFRQFLFNWIALLRTFEIQPESPEDT